MEIQTYTADQLAKMFQVHKKTIRRWADKGKLPKPVVDDRWDKLSFDAWYAGKLGTNGTFGTSGTQQQNFHC